MPLTGTEFTVVTDQVPSALSPVPCCTEALHGAGIGLAWPGLAATGPSFVALPSTIQAISKSHPPAVSCPTHKPKQTI